MAAPNTQTIDGTVKPKKLPESGAAKPIKLIVDVSSTNSGNANQVPNPTTRREGRLRQGPDVPAEGLPDLRLERLHRCDDDHAREGRIAATP